MRYETLSLFYRIHGRNLLDTTTNVGTKSGSGSLEVKEVRVRAAFSRRIEAQPEVLLHLYACRRCKNQPRIPNPPSSMPS